VSALAYRLQPARWLLLVALFFIAGCALPARAPATFNANGQASSWSGRLSLRVDAEPAQSFAAGFDLRGSAVAGELSLYSPLGSTLAVLAWAPGSATLRANNEVRSFASLEELAAQAVGTAIPVAALFDWLAGTPTPVAGWQADLGQLDHGRLVARRSQPAPAAELRLALEQ